ncbi:protein FAM200A-like [Cardiocondyla obscurior]|uniref:protein FAM200A-like n=1 Tax=Cardiocondyla obscurior TaxID=286306 RepID=UPI0039656A44
MESACHKNNIIKNTSSSSESKTHIDNLKEYEETNTELCTEHNETFLSFDDRKKIAEIRYAALIADKNISFDTAEIILNYFQDVGKDPDVLKNETSDITNEKWMTFHVRYVDPETLNIHSQLVKLINLDAKDCSAKKLFNAFKTEMWKLKIPFQNIVALSCDNAAVMKGKNLSFKTQLEKINSKVLTLSCPCHSIALVANAACDKIPHVYEDFIKKMAYYVNSSPKRSAIFREFCNCFQETSHKLLRLCETRWLSRHMCIERILESWDTIKHFLTDMIVNEKSSVAENLKCTMQIETRIHLLHPKLMHLLIQLCENFLKQEVLKNVLNVTFSLNENQKPLENITLGSDCEEYLDDLSNNGHADEANIIRKNCLEFYVTAAEQICKKLPINNKFLFKLKVFQHAALFDAHRDITFNDVSFVAETIGGFDKNGLKNEWSKIHLDFTDAEKQHLATLNFDNMWKEIFKSKNNIQRYENLKSLINTVRTFPNSNADSERVFSFLTDIKTKKRNQLSSASVNAICVKSALRTKKQNILNMSIDENHIALMSTDNLYAKHCIKKKSTLTLYSAYDNDDNNAVASSSNNNEIVTAVISTDHSYAKR